VFNSLSRPAIVEFDLSICQGLLNTEYLAGTSMSILKVLILRLTDVTPSEILGFYSLHLVVNSLGQRLVQLKEVADTTGKDFFILETVSTDFSIS
jgi:hypothetical protein